MDLDEIFYILTLRLQLKRNIGIIRQLSYIIKG